MWLTCINQFRFSIGTFSHFDTQRCNKNPPQRMRGHSSVAGNTADHNDWRPWLDPASKHSRGAISTQCYIQLWRVRLAGARLCCRKGTSCEAECEKGRVKSVRACVVLFRLNMIYTEWVIHTCEWHIFPDKRFSRESVTSRAWKAKHGAALFQETDNIATNLAATRLP